MIVVDGMPVSPELVAFLKSFTPRFEHDETSMSISAHYLSRIQDYFCRNLGMIEEEERKDINEFLETLVSAKDILYELSKLLPVINRD